MILEREDTWPSGLVSFLDANHELLMAAGRHDDEIMHQYLNQTGTYRSHWQFPANPHNERRENVTLTAVSLLQGVKLQGWHCTRLTQLEVDHIARQGMQLPNLNVLNERIGRVLANGELTYAVAERLCTENEADHEYRKGRVWFCFFPPHVAGQSGIERFFRRWGGEALYNSHEGDAETDLALMRIGRPCLIEAAVPISGLTFQFSLGEKIVRRYLFNRGLPTEECMDHEDNSRLPIRPENILRFVFHGEREFSELTHCDRWTPPL